MRYLSFVATTLIGTTALVACGLDAVDAITAPDLLPSSSDSGVSDDDRGEPTSPPTDDAAAPESDAGDAAPSPTCAAAGTACSAALAEGWKPVGLLGAHGDACPLGYAALDLFQAAGDATCDCTPTPAASDPPSCEREPKYTARLGNVVGDVGCTIAHDPYDVASGKCVPLKLSDIAKNGGRFPTIQHKGLCELTCTGNDAQLPKTTWRVCEPSAACTETACLGVGAAAEGAPMEYCLEHEGDVPCPDDDAGAFRAITANTALTVACTGGSCENDLQCTDGTVHVFGSLDCSSAELTAIPTNEQCLALKDGAKAFQYTATTVSVASTVKTPAQANIVAMGTKTICCRGGTP